MEIADPAERATSQNANGGPDAAPNRSEVARAFGETYGRRYYNLLMALKSQEPHRYPRALVSIEEGRGGDVARHLVLWARGREHGVER